MSEKDTYEAWTGRVKKELGDRPLASLDWMSPTGLPLKAYYPIDAETKKYPVLITREKKEWDETYAWDVIEYILVNSCKEANQQALKALSNGATGLFFEWPEAQPDEVPKLLAGINLEYIELGLQIPAETWSSCASALHAFMLTRNFPLEKCKGFFQADLANCIDGENLATSIQILCEKKIEQENLLPGFRFGALNLAFLGSAGLSSDWELAVGLAIFSCQLGFQQKNSLAPTQITLSIGSDYFSELAKFRIAGHLFDQIALRHGVNTQHYIMGVMNQTYLSHLDTYTNILRLGTSAMSAILGGCNGLVLLPFISDSPENPDFVQRVTRNVQLVLLHESGIAQVQDPAAGSSFIEELSFRLSEQVMDNYQVIMKEGGILEFLRSGHLDTRILAAKEQILEEVRTGKRFFLGVNQYLNPKELAKQAMQKEGLYAPLRASAAMDIKEKELSHG